MIKSYSKFISRLALKNLGKNSVRYSVHCTEWNRERLEQLWMRRQILGPDPPTPRALKPNWYSTMMTMHCHTSFPTMDLQILLMDFPPKDETLTDSFFAVVGGINHDSGCQKAERFVQDFLLTKLYGKDINEIFNVREPELLLMAVLKSRGESAPEPRLLRQSGSFTVTPIYVVGFYVEKQLLGQSAGESVSIARKMAARESLKVLFGTNNLESRSPYVFDRDHNLDDLKNRTNYRFSSEISDNEASLLLDLVNSVENEPLTPDLLNTTFKNVIEPTFGVVLRRRLKHYFYKGTPHRKVKRNFIQPKPETI